MAGPWLSHRRGIGPGPRPGRWRGAALCFLPLACLVLVTVARPGSGNGSESAALSDGEIHAIAWPAARDYYNREVASDESARGSPGFIDPLRSDEFDRPSVIQRSEDRIWVGYARPAGPSISVKMKRSGEILKIKASYSNL